MEIHAREKDDVIIFDIEGEIVTPNWISANVSGFTLNPDQKIIVSFFINSLASPGMNDSIQFIVWEIG